MIFRLVILPRADLTQLVAYTQTAMGYSIAEQADARPQDTELQKLILTMKEITGWSHLYLTGIFACKEYTLPMLLHPQINTTVILSSGEGELLGLMSGPLTAWKQALDVLPLECQDEFARHRLI